MNTLLLLAGLFLSLLILPLWTSSQHSIGPDRIAGPIAFFFLLALRWVCFSIVLLRSAARGALTPEPAGIGPCFLLFVAYSVMELFSLLVATEARGGWIVVPIVVPLPMALYLFWWIQRAEGSAVPPMARRFALASVAGVALCIFVGVAVVTFLQERLEQDPRRIASRKDGDQRVMYHMYTGSDYISKPLGFLGPGVPADLRSEVLADLAKRPRLIPELASELEGYQLYAAGNAVTYLALMNPGPPPELNEPFHHFVENLGARIGEHMTTGEVGEEFLMPVRAAILGVQAYRAADLRPRLATMAKLLRKRESERATVSEIEAFLAGAQ